MDDNPYQSPAAPPASDPPRLGVVCPLLSGISFLGVGLLIFLLVKSIRHLAALGPDWAGNPMDLAFAAWAGLNVVSFGMVGLGLWSRRRRLTAIGGSTLVVSTLVLSVL